MVANMLFSATRDLTPICIRPINGFTRNGSQKCGRQVKDSVMFEEYLNNPRGVPPTELLADIHRPLA
ncbi:hypothetical protein EV132_11650 [Rhizobium sullae]|uniref:Uncharacterized protein n=1 Tax=Rhizobium sullae TaxID=50338 RepID=A0A4R3PW27_RHISU|nr:hypothetical protein EV132_11650 [Rhizobium sullae]